MRFGSGDAGAQPCRERPCQLPGVYRFSDVVVHARVQAGLAVGGHRVGRHGHDGRSRVALIGAQGARGGKTVHHRHLHVHQHEVVIAPGAAPERFFAVFGLVRLYAGFAQEPEGDLAVEFVVLHQEDPRVFVAGHGRRGLRLSAFLRCGDARGEPERAARALRAFHADAAPEQVRQLAADGQSQARAAVAPRDAVVGLVECLEKILHLRGIHADARVAHIDPEKEFTGSLPVRKRRGAHRHGNRSPLGEFFGVGKVIHEDLPDPERIAFQPVGNSRIDIHREGKSFRLDFRSHEMADGLDQFRQQEGPAVRVHLAGLDLRKIEDFVQDAHELVARVVYLVQIGADLGRRRGFPRQVRHAQNRVHRGADFVAHVGQEGALRLAGGLGRRASLHEGRVDGPFLGDVVDHDHHFAVFHGRHAPAFAHPRPEYAAVDPL